MPGFDEFLLGYADRGFAIPQGLEERVVPGGNGMFRPTVVKGGQVIGTWKRAGTSTNRRIEAEPFTAFGPRDLASMRGRFSELP